MSKPKRAYNKAKTTINPMTYTFIYRTNTKHRRSVHAHRMDETPLSYAVHQKVTMPGKNYLRHITEWFEKALWAYHEPNRPRRKRVAEAKPFEPPKMEAPVEAPKPIPHPTMESPKNAPPPITLVDDDDDTAEIPVASVKPAAPVAAKADPLDPNVELPTEYNPRAHKELAAGAPEDLIVFDAMVDANFIAQQRRNRMMALQAKQMGRVLKTTPNNPIVSGFEPG